VLTLAIVNQKGGVGKTTTAVTLGHGLALAGRQALIVDLDAQGNVSDALGIDKAGGLYDLLFGNKSKATCSTGRKNLDLVPSDKTTVKVKQELIAVDFREYVLKSALDELRGYDAILLDSAPGVDVMQVSALVACTHFIIPVALDHLAVVGAGDALATTAGLKKVGRFGGEFLGILPTMWERTTRESHEQLKILVEQYPDLVWPPIPQDVKAREAPAYGQTLWEYAPKTRALAGVEINGQRIGGYRAVLKRLLEEVL
jgi:chromosome partitioning protein